ncbi:hypothetical protein H5410_013930 [Solanum commersonii]|uniref:Reverse transcriptase n=1 Tax=Solanum commersonii TaxID=4109 RepID=A0A9J5ZPV8_SOLCO|nr:hypothetical protein H5410_013930 [Solanum commersonii]
MPINETNTILSEGFRNEDIQDKVRVYSVVDKMREARLKWFGHVKKEMQRCQLRKCNRLDMVDLRRSSGRLKKY